MVFGTLYNFSGYFKPDIWILRDTSLIILAAPSATMTYVMAKEIGGDPDLGGAAISFSTLLSALTYTFWLGIV